MRPGIKHRFFCINCGKEGLPVYRQRGHLHKSNHRKVMFCIYCNKDVNHIECSNDLEVKQFKQDFKDGLYKQEAQESLNYNNQK